ncbi:MAG: putative glycoside hydrolase [Patescibacteria group bacterium]
MSITSILSLLALVISGNLPTFQPLPIQKINRPPQEVKAIYLTAYTAQGQRMDELIDIIDKTELNAVVINIKEPSGVKFWNGLDQLLVKLKQHNIWTIARLVVFQDDDLPLRQQKLALTYANGKLWRDSGGRLWLDPTAKEIWQYNSNIAKQALALGFDEINLDYIRFPSDGDVSAIKYPVWDKKKDKEEVIAEFAQWIANDIKKFKPHTVISVDVFAFTFVQDWDLDIGQRLSLLAQYFDVVAPMIYPSHYRAGNFGFNNPAEHPQEVVKETLETGKSILKNSKVIIRPWLQDFNMGAKYTPELVRAQINAIQESGYNSGWMLWNPSNKYTTQALYANP